MTDRNIAEGKTESVRVSYKNRIIQISRELLLFIVPSFTIVMNAAAVQDFLAKIFSTAFGCPQRGASRDQMVRAG